MKRIVAICFELECGHVVRSDPRWPGGTKRRKCPLCEGAPGVVVQLPAVTVPADARDCICCGAAYVPGALYPDWCNACEYCDPAGLFDNADGKPGPPTFDPRCPKHGHRIETADPIEVAAAHAAQDHDFALGAGVEERTKR